MFEFDAFRAALGEGRLAYAALDLLDPTPELLALPNLIVTRRRAAYTRPCDARRVAIWKQHLTSHLERRVKAPGRRKEH